MIEKLDFASIPLKKATTEVAADLITYEQIKRAAAVFKNNALDAHQKTMEANRKTYDNAYSFADKKPEAGNGIFVLWPDGRWQFGYYYPRFFDDAPAYVRWIYREVERND